ncbi:MAG: c-type cytochrome [Deltaproteobacteria bacterium]|nr:c-type cytochrome [Deltaproteobacteria bacterium]
MKKLFFIPLFILLFTACSKEEEPPLIILTNEVATDKDKKKTVFTKPPKQMRHCTPCHNFKKEGKRKIGPNLYGIVGKKVGQAEGFRYSKAFAEGEWTWTRENIRLIISRSTGAATEVVKTLSGDPSAKTNMKFYGAGDSDAEIILDYLETLK